MPLTSSQQNSRDKPPRKRNVVSRGRTGCLTCRRRRLKCDETKPGCNNCRRVNVPCEGYAQKITFKDQTNFIVERAKGKSAKKKEETIPADNSSSSSSPSSDSLSPELQKRPSIASSKSSTSHNGLKTCYSFVDVKKDDINPASPDDSKYPNNQSVAIDKGYMTPCSPESIDFTVSPGRVVPNSFLCLSGTFEFPEDYTYFEYTAGDKFSSLSKVLPLSELLKAGPVAPHVYNAGFALAALTLSGSEPQPRGSIPLRRHAFHHSLKAVQGLQDELSRAAQGPVSGASLNDVTVLSLFATIMLLANFELQRGSLLAWRSHMQGAASCLTTGYKKIIAMSAGMLLVKSFARMALLLRLYNEDYSVTKPETMPPKLTNWLNLLLQQSSNLQDRILLMVEEITALEIQKRQQPELDAYWTQKSVDLLRRLEEWRGDLPVSEIPVEDPTCESYLTISSYQHSSLERVSALCFPRSTDSCSSAVNYATYLCIGMRARTRYPPNSERVLPPDVEQTALKICRIAAGILPARFGESFTYSYGMLPSVVGAYRWSTNPGLRSWAKHWLAGYRGTREGIWNISQTLRLIAAMDKQYPTHKPSGWQFVAVRMVDEPTDPSPDLEEGNKDAPFKIVMHSRTPEGHSSKFLVVE